MLYEDPTKELSSDERFHVELHFSPGVNCCIHKDLPPGPGFRPQSRRQRNVDPNPDNTDGGPIQQGRFICTPEGVTGTFSFILIDDILPFLHFRTRTT